MANIDDGLRLLGRILSLGEFAIQPTAQKCFRMIESSDEKAAIGWLISVLVRLESDEKHQWTRGQSGIILWEAGLITIDQRGQGVAAVLETMEAPS